MVIAAGSHLFPFRTEKPACADGTAMQCGRVGGRLLLYSGPRFSNEPGLFFVLIPYLMLIGMGGILSIILLSVLSPMGGISHSAQGTAHLSVDALGEVEVWEVLVEHFPSELTY